MKTIKNKELLVAADFSGFDLKEAIVKHLENKGWKITDVGIIDKNEEPREMFHRIGFKAGSLISEGEFERALIFCGTGVGIQLAASKCPGVRAANVNNISETIRAIEGNDVNMLSMGGFYTAPQLGIKIAEAYLNTEFCGGNYEWKYFNAFHKLAVDEINEFEYEKYKAAGFKIENPKTLEDYDYLYLEN